MTEIACDLRPDEAHLWYLRTETASDPRLLETLDRILTVEEREKRERFHFPKGRLEYFLTRVLVRKVLSRYFGVLPERFRFTEGRFGRPVIRDPENPLGIRFNLAHSDGLIVCLVALERDVGVDVEHTGRSGKLMEIAERNYAPAELEALRALQPDKCRKRFFDYWTLKESFIKALGIGLSLGLDCVSFHFQEHSIRATFDPGLDQSAEDWQFKLLGIDPNHVVAICLGKPRGRDAEVRIQEALPLLSSEGFSCS